MWTHFRYTLRHFRWQILGWGIGLAALGLILVPFYDVFMQDKEGFAQFIESYPPEMMAFFGDMSAASFFTPAGYLDLYMSYMPIVLGIFTVAAGAALIANDEESGRLDLILAHPVSRTGLFLGRLAAFVLSTVGILFLCWLGFSIPLGASSLGVSWGQMALPCLSMLAFVLLIGALALALSMVLPSRRLASMTAGLVMVASYVLSGLANLNEDMRLVAQLLPYEYYQGGKAAAGLNLAWFFGLLGVGVLLALLAWWRFLRRDVRVAGEASWRLPVLPFRRRVRGKA